MNVWQIWWIALGVKALLLPLLPITPDEAYYFQWARHPALSYFDHPPMIAWIMTVALPLWKTPLGIRLPGMFVGHAALIPWVKILQRFGLPERSQKIWLLCALLGPLTGLGGFLITPDIPLLFFWSFACWALLWTMDNPGEPRRWLALGALIGLGLLSKYMMILFFPAALIWWAWENRASIVKTPGPWQAVVVAFVFFLPVIIWNMRNHFASFAFQTRHGLGGSFKWNWPAEYLTGQFGLINPFWVIPAAWFAKHHFKTNKFLVVFAAVPLAFFFLTSFRGRVEANWPVCAYPAVMALAVYALPEWEKTVKRGLAVSAVFVFAVLTHTIHPWLPVSKAKDHTEIVREWLPDVPALKNVHPLYARSYQMAAFHSYYRSAEHEVFKLPGMDRRDFYDFLPEAELPEGVSHIILKADDILPPDILLKYELRNGLVLPSHLMLYEINKRVRGR